MAAVIDVTKAERLGPSARARREFAVEILFHDERTDGELGFSLAHMFDQTTVLLAYTSLDRLLDGLGETQRWGVLETKRLPEVQEQTNFDKIEIDRYIEPDARERKAQ